MKGSGVCVCVYSCAFLFGCYVYITFMSRKLVLRNVSLTLVLVKYTQVIISLAVNELRKGYVCVGPWMLCCMFLFGCSMYIAFNSNTLMLRSTSDGDGWLFLYFFFQEYYDVKRRINNNLLKDLIRSGQSSMCVFFLSFLHQFISLLFLMINFQHCFYIENS